MDGLVLSGSNNHFVIRCEDGVIRRCGIKGKRIKNLTGTYNSLAAGDRVEVEPDEQTADTGLVITMMPRKSVYGRFNEKGRAEQAIAANIDLVVCVSSPALPPFRPRFIDRVAVLAEAAHVPLLIVLNKIDLGKDEEVDSRLADYRNLGYSTLGVSASSGEGLVELRSRIQGITSVFAGQSGVGKTSLLNRLEPSIHRRTGEVSIKFERGKHTTTLATLYEMPDGVTRIIDTPGVRRLALRGIVPESLVAYFPEMAKIAPDCLYGLSCRHEDENGCCIIKAVDSGTLNLDRYESYVRIRAELEAAPEWKRDGTRDPGRRDRSFLRRRGGAGSSSRSPDDWVEHQD